MGQESYTVREASRALGFSVPTVIRMCEEGTLRCFVSPGGHRRIPCEAVAAIRANGRTRSSPSAAPTSVLQSHQERVQELHLDAQELRERRELRRLQAEENVEAERQAADARLRETEREERREQVHAERLRQERLNEEAEARARRTRLRQQVQIALNLTLPAGLPSEKQRELAETLDAELSRANAEDAEMAIPIIKAVTDRFVASCVAEARAQRTRKRILESAVREICWMRGSIETNESEAANAVRGALSSLAADATESELRCAAKAAVAPIREKIEQRVRRKEIIEAAVRGVFPYLERLHRAGGITRETLTDFSFRRDLEETVRRRLEGELQSEDPGAVRRQVHEVVDSEIEKPEAD